MTLNIKRRENTEAMLTAIKNHRYEQMWQCYGYTMLSMDLGVLFPFSRVKQRICSFVDKNWLFTYENNLGSMYYNKEEMKLAEHLGTVDFLNKKWFSKYLKQSKQLYKSAWKLFHIYSKEKTEKLGDKELYAVTKKVGLLLAEIYGYFNTAQPQCVQGLEKLLTKELEKNVPSEKVTEVMLELTRPDEPTLLEEENREWLKICMAKTQNSVNFLQQHAAKYGVLGTSDEGKYWDVEHYKKLLEKCDKKQSEKELKQIKMHYNKLVLEKSNLIKKYNIPKEAVALANILAKTGRNRFELRLRGWMPLDYWFIKILIPLLSKRMKMNAALLRQMTFDELLEFMYSKKFDEIELRKRQECFVIGMNQGKVFLKSGRDAKALMKVFLPQELSNIKLLVGQTASKGKARGKAFVLHWTGENLTSEMEKMEVGNILVAGQTRPQLMPVIRKAAAVVTDEGGITSHAAIVSRELGIPCVIGTKIATRVLTDGDLIEVDADNGIVRIL